MEKRVQIQRHRVSNGGRQRRAAHDKLLQKPSQIEARRKEGASDKLHAMEKHCRPAGLGARGLENKIMKMYAAMKSHVKKLKEAADAISLGTEWMNETPHEVELALLRERARTCKCHAEPCGKQSRRVERTTGRN